jgi:hypothetical protein
MGQPGEHWAWRFLSKTRSRTANFFSHLCFYIQSILTEMSGSVALQALQYAFSAMYMYQQRNTHDCN